MIDTFPAYYDILTRNNNILHSRQQDDQKDVDLLNLHIQSSVRNMRLFDR